MAHSCYHPIASIFIVVVISSPSPSPPPPPSRWLALVLGVFSSLLPVSVSRCRYLPPTTTND
jgi:hypothetical protein